MPTLNLENVPTKLFIGGEWIAGSNPDLIKVTNPATGEVIAEIANASPEDGRLAAEAANTAQDAFAAMPAQERSKILLKAHALLLESKDELAAIMTAEMGKPFAEARGEIDYSAGYLQWYAQEGLRVQGSHGQSPSGRGQILLTREPVGVSFLITPWNFPLAMGARKIAPAVATGCAVVVKPAEKTPLTMLFLARIFQKAGIPAGTLNVVTTTNSSKLTGPILEDGLVRHLSFTGSTKVGSILHGQCSKHMIRTSLELGGNAPFIIFEDADLDKAVTEVTAAKMRNMGEACTAANRILVHESLADEFGTRLAARFEQFTVGNGLDEGVDIGPMIDQTSCERLQGLVDNAVAGGARILIGGELPEGAGSFYPPTVLADVPRDADLTSQELFGPVAPIIPFKDEADAIEIANDTEYGLASYLLTNDLARAMRVSGRLEAGMVGINTGIISDVAAPLGGVKASGLGREGGVLGIDEFLEYKYTFIPND
ncbi:NAD-dependent succinate-semialdehyde dehydrogenase [Pseudoclavibacter terrae]|uniref:NAD-dependent succinate-semialdehyde dehydrogenase n=1 Tax=Pseudoclavibacter terrae TaxID=1530195 RepID=A0A7J5AXC6_9MICO|nr:NAD-dependent succinate-semialdehyde dehydrogenase [Pseudoclavibacter terrae]KAB1636103.1 NAD-dependent succinate-semialdehyde dehydrogenase [Pseudoclavibacter terrae]